MTGRSPADWKILDIQNQALHCNDMVSLVYNNKIRLITGGPRMDSGGEGEQRCRGDLANRLTGTLLGLLVFSSSVGLRENLLCSVILQGSALSRSQPPVVTG